MVVHFPEYQGGAIWPHLPRTWLPIPCAEVRHKKLKSVTRAGLPLRLAWALTIHKSQGITAREGCIVSFDGCRASSVAKLGLAFVAWTRAERWSRQGFYKLPPLGDFLSARLCREFEARRVFEHKADALFASLLSRRGTSLDALLAAHEQHLAAATFAKEGRRPSDAEAADLRAMLGAVGVAPISDSVTTHCAQQSGRKAAGPWSFVAAFRAEKKRAPKKGARHEPETNSDTQHLATQNDLTTGAVASSENSAAQTMIDMGFQEVDITRALEQTSFVFGRALLLLLNGLDSQRTKHDAFERFRRHGLKTVRGVHSEMLGGDAVVAQYKQRARDEFHFEPNVRDLGQYAGRTTGACFWLCLAAGLAECGHEFLAQALPGNPSARQSMAELRAEGVQRCVDMGVRDSPLGLTAEALRTHFCAGDAAVLLRPDMKAKVYPAFAGLDVRGPARTEQLYRRWVQKLAAKEYADELVVLCVALELAVHITVIPFTPPAALQQWAAASYRPSGLLKMQVERFTLATTMCTTCTSPGKRQALPAPLPSVPPPERAGRTELCRACW